MPYFLHAQTDPPERGIPFVEKSDAVARRCAGQTITYLSNDEERETWIQRERRRLIDRTYTALPWLDDDGLPQRRYRTPLNSSDGYGDVSIFNAHTREELEKYYIASRYHFAHVSLRSDAMIAYTPSDEHGIADRQTRIRCGRYLDLVAPWLLPIEKDKLCAMIRSMCGATFKLARTASEIRAVYRAGQGFSSCMDGRNFPDDDETNPVSAYGESDLAVAYLGDLQDETPRVTARCVVWPGKKIYTRIYGDELIACLLKQDGWTDPGWEDSFPLTGARIRAIKAGNGRRYVMPYLDTANTVRLTDDGKFFELCSDDDRGDFNARETNGTTRSRSHSCDHCGSAFIPYDDETECNSCREQRWACSSCSESFHEDDNYETVNNYRGYTRRYCESCVDSISHNCDRCDAQFFDCQFSPATQRDRQNDDLEDYCGSCATIVTDERTADLDDESTDVTTVTPIIATADTETIALPFSDDDDEWFWRSTGSIGGATVWMHNGRQGFYATPPYATWINSNFRRDEIMSMTREYVRCADPRGVRFRNIPIGTSIRVCHLPHHTGTKIGDREIRWNACEGSDHCSCSPGYVGPSTTPDIPLDNRYEVIS